MTEKTEHIWMDAQDGLIIVGDVLDGLEHLDDNSMDAIVTDPPYDLLQASRKGSGRSNNPNSPAGRHGDGAGGFMGMAWDATGVAFDPKTWEACMRVLKPGGHLLAFGGTRTHHRLWCAIEDAGFEVRDCVLWLQGQGFPKSLDVGKAIDKAAGAEREVVAPPPYTRGRAGQSYSETRRVSYDYPAQPITAPATDEAKQWDGWGTALKPAHEPILLARKPLSEKTVAANVLKWGAGGLNIDGTRISTDDNLGGGAYAEKGTRQDLPGADRSDKAAGMLAAGKVVGREYQQPTGRWPANVVLDEEAAAQLDEQSGKLKSGGGDKGNKTIGAQGYGSNVVAYSTKEYVPNSGGASRFFYCSKASKKERGEGNKHPTIKPLALMRWLVRMVTPPDGVVLDPFCGSGTTLMAAVEEGVGFVGIDLSPEYCEIAKRRVKGLGK